MKRKREVYFFQIDKCCKQPRCSNNPPFPIQNWNRYYKVCTESVLFDTVKSSKTNRYLMKNARRSFDFLYFKLISATWFHGIKNPMNLLCFIWLKSRPAMERKSRGSSRTFWRSMRMRLERSNVQNYKNSTFWNFFVFSFSNGLETLNEVVWDRYAPGYNLRCWYDPYQMW